MVIAPPLKGSRWVVGGGCCTPYSYHRGATLPINGGIRVAERYAIDFVQLNDKNMLSRVRWISFRAMPSSVKKFTLSPTARSWMWPMVYPSKCLANCPKVLTIQMAAGNYVVVDIGEGRFAFYAHLQPGSLRVKVGDKVTTGQVLGLLGNSGNTDGPHLHFHVMDSPSPLVSNGLPYVFTSFTGQGIVKDTEPLLTGGQAVVDESALAGPHKNQLPLNDELVSFP